MKTNQQHIDVKLIEAFQAGDKNAIAQLVKRWHLEFCKKAYWLVNDADLSKDIAQESWRTIIDKLYTLEKPSSFKSWAFRIVYSKSMDALRERTRKRSRDNELKYEYDVVTDEVIQDKAELKALLLRAIQDLPEHQQLVIRLFYTEEYSLKEISKTLGVSIGTTKSRLFHAREKLKQIVNKKHK